MDGPRKRRRRAGRLTGKGCLYVKRLDDVDHKVLRELVERTMRVHRGADRSSTGV